MTQYAGLCIGGPMAGQSIAQPKQQFKVAATLHENLAASVTEATEPVEHVYTWQHIGPFALWIHSSTDLNHALEEMAIAYSEKHHATPRA